jgi:hypothetical protein
VFSFIASKFNGLFLVLVAFALIMAVMNPAQIRLPLLFVTAYVLFRIVRRVETAARSVRQARDTSDRTRR